MKAPDEKTPEEKLEVKKRKLAKRLTKTPGQAAIAGLVAALTTLILPTLCMIESRWDLCREGSYSVPLAAFYIKLSPVAFIAALLCALLARYIHRVAAILICLILLAVLAVINLLMMFFPTGC